LGQFDCRCRTAFGSIRYDNFRIPSKIGAQPHRIDLSGRGRPQRNGTFAGDIAGEPRLRSLLIGFDPGAGIIYIKQSPTDLEALGGARRSRRNCAAGHWHQFAQILKRALRHHLPLLCIIERNPCLASSQNHVPTSHP